MWKKNLCVEIKFCEEKINLCVGNKNLCVGNNNLCVNNLFYENEFVVISTYPKGVPDSAHNDPVYIILQCIAQ